MNTMKIEHHHILTSTKHILFIFPVCNSLICARAQMLPFEYCMARPKLTILPFWFYYQFVPYPLDLQKGYKHRLSEKREVVKFSLSLSIYLQCETIHFRLERFKHVCSEYCRSGLTTWLVKHTMGRNFKSIFMFNILLNTLFIMLE